MMLALLLAASPSAPRSMAVLELRDKLTGAERELIDASFLTDVVRQQALEDVPSLKMMTRENVIALLEASGKRLEDCEGECEVDTGRNLGADLVVSGELLRFGRGFRVNLRLHDTHSAQLLSAAVASGNSAEALEKDLNRAVARLMDPLTNGQPLPKRAEWIETAGFYLTGTVGPMSTENDTPRALASPVNSVTMSNLQSRTAGVGLGVRYRPWNWIMLDAAYYFAAPSAQAGSLTGTGHASSEQTFSVGSIAASVNAFARLAGTLHGFAGVGAQYFSGNVGNDAPIDGNGVVRLASEAGTGQSSDPATQLSFVRLLVRAGVEWRPQERVGIDVFGVVYSPHEVDVYVNDTQSAAGTGDPILKYTLPVITGNAALALYF